MKNLEQAIQTMVQLDPDYQAFSAALPLDVSGIGLPDGLVNNAADLLQFENPDPFSRILAQTPL